jgi:hypothetical protein
VHKEWFKRADLSTRDNWRWDLCLSGSGNCFCAGPDALLGQGRRLLAGITSSFRTFLVKFNNKDSNILDSYILNNPSINMANNFPYNLDEKFWTQHSDCNIYKIARLKVKDFLNNGKLESLNTLNNKYGAKISPATYLRLVQFSEPSRKNFA